MSMLQEEASKYIRQVSDNVYVLDAISRDELTEFKHRIIDCKIEVVEKNIKLTANDLALVRTLPVLPNNLTYDNAQTEGILPKMVGPFEDLIGYIKNSRDFAHVNLGCNRKKINPDDAKLNYLLYRDTKHFSLNGLASDVCYESGVKRFSFTDRSIIMIEPFTDHIDKTLAVLNPVDTFYDLSNDSFKIGNNGVVILSFDTYKKLIRNPQKRKDLSKLKVFLFSPENIKVLSYESANTYVTDIILSYLGYIPMNSIDQIKLKSDGYIDEKTGKILEDDMFVEKFHDLIDDLSNKLLGLPYRHLPDEIINRRSKDTRDLLGIHHCETKYSDDEIEKNLLSKLDTAKKYFDYLEEHLGLNNVLSFRLYEQYVDFIRDCHDSMYRTIFCPPLLEFDMVAFLEKVGYKKFIEATKKFNSLPKDKEIFKEDYKGDTK